MDPFTSPRTTSALAPNTANSNPEEAAAMILDHYNNLDPNKTSYLIACPKTREAALINPQGECVSAYEETLARRNLRLVQVLLTHENSEVTDPVIERLQRGRQNLEVHSGTSHLENGPLASSASQQEQTSGDPLLALGQLRIQALRPAAHSSDQVSYRVESYTFTSEKLLVDYPEPEQFCASDETSLSPAQRFDGEGRSRGKVRNFRTTRENVSIEQMLLEDLHTSLIEDAFSPKETLVVRAYIELLEENEYAHPSAAQLGENIGNIDRSVIHVLVHSIRWKQIDRDRLPLVLSGQASKWLRSLKTEPEFTPHEQEFLCAYLRLVKSNGTPPSGPDIVAELTSQRSIQWVRKRAFTVRRKQREFGQALLILARNKSEAEPRRLQPITIAPPKVQSHRFISEQVPIA